MKKLFLLFITCVLNGAEISRAKICAIALSAEDKQLAIARDNGSVSLSEILPSSSQPQEPFVNSKIFDLAPSSLVFNRQGNQIAVGAGIVVKILKAVDLANVSELTSNLPITSGAFNQNGSKFAAGTSRDNNYPYTSYVVIWDVQSGTPLKIVPFDTYQPVKTLSFSTNESLVALGWNVYRIKTNGLTEWQGYFDVADWTTFSNNGAFCLYTSNNVLHAIEGVPTGDNADLGVVFKNLDPKGKIHTIGDEGDFIVQADSDKINFFRFGLWIQKPQRNK